MKNFIRVNLLPLLVVLFFGALASRTLLFQSGYFNMHDDLQMMRQLEMEKCFIDGQIPCRWVPDMGYGFGFPLFNFYPPLPYLIGQVFRLVGFTFIATAKLTFASSLILSGVFMYLLAKEFFGRLGGTLSSVFYIWAPYHAVDIYVRGAMNEAWALTWFPLILWTAYRLILSHRRGRQIEGNHVAGWAIGFALSYAALLMTHNLMVLIFTPVVAGWVLLHLWQKNEWKKIPAFIFSGFLAFGLSAYFTFPALFENKFTQVASQLIGYYDYTAHFVSIRQLLFSRYWGYGPSVWGDIDDRMSFQIGYIHWGLSLFIGILLVVKGYRILKREGIKGIVKDNLLLTTLLLLFIGWFAAFMTHSRSTPIYQSVEQLAYVQFSWRFLTIVIFAFSFVMGYLAPYFHSKKKFFDYALAPFRLLLFGLLIVSVVIYSWKYFLPEHGKMGKLTDEEKFTAAAWDLQQTAGIYDYLPATAKEAPKSPRTVPAEFMEGEGVITPDKEGTNWVRFVAQVNAENSVVRINTFDFPGWKVFVDGAPVNHFIPETERWGRMYISLSRGEHYIEARFFDTPIRKISNIISLVSWIGLAFFFLKNRKAKSIYV